MENITDESFIALICNGEFNSIPGFNIGELFESFFDNINYNVIKENENIFVDFTGEAICDDNPCTILIRFKIDDNAEEFEINEVKVNEDILNETEVLDLLEDIAYVGGATLDEEFSGCENGNCSSCSGCDSMYNAEDEEPYDNDDYDYEEDDDENEE